MGNIQCKWLLTNVHFPKTSIENNHDRSTAWTSNAPVSFQLLDHRNLGIIAIQIRIIKEGDYKNNTEIRDQLEANTKRLILPGGFNYGDRRTYSLIAHLWKGHQTLGNILPNGAFKPGEIIHFQHLVETVKKHHGYFPGHRSFITRKEEGIQLYITAPFLKAVEDLWIYI